MAYSCCLSLGGNFDCLDLKLQRNFYNIDHLAGKPSCYLTQKNAFLRVKDFCPKIKYSFYLSRKYRSSFVAKTMMNFENNNLLAVAVFSVFCPLRSLS